jgi:hypothetical protein
MEPLSASLHVDEREQAGPLAAPPVSFEVLYRLAPRVAVVSR